MKVKELMAILKNFPPEAEAVIWDNESGDVVGINHIERMEVKRLEGTLDSLKVFRPCKGGQEVVRVSFQD